MLALSLIRPEVALKGFLDVMFAFAGSNHPFVSLFDQSVSEKVIFIRPSDASFSLFFFSGIFSHKAHPSSLE